MGETSSGGLSVGDGDGVDDLEERHSNVKRTHHPGLEAAGMVGAFAGWVSYAFGGFNFYSAALMGWIYIAWRERMSKRLWVVLGLTSLPSAFVLGFTGIPVAAAVLWGSFLVFKCVERGEDYRVLIPVFVLASLLLFSARQRVVISHTPQTVDAALLSLDSRLFASASTRIWKWWAARRNAERIVEIVYSSLPLAAIVVLYHCPNRTWMKLGVCLFASALFAVPSYLMVPAVGPAHLSADYAPRNCMPSLHVSWMLILWWTRGVLPWWERPLLTVFTIATIVSTLATGEHYLLDIIAAIPFTALMIYLVRLVDPFLSKCFAEPLPLRFHCSHSTSAKIISAIFGKESSERSTTR